ncbi:hypothetical protein DOY81_011124 [Sarcophaga bullata]|nr:hypothetical protein DOY81_011124 [Sarcophaga bullata]
MEVDDAIVMTEPAEEETVLAGRGVDDRNQIKDTEVEQTTPSGSTSAKQKRSQNNDSMSMATPFKLEVLGSKDEKEEEDDGDGDGFNKPAIRRKFYPTIEITSPALQAARSASK